MACRDPVRDRPGFYQVTPDGPDAPGRAAHVPHDHDLGRVSRERANPAGPLHDDTAAEEVVRSIYEIDDHALAVTSVDEEGELLAEK